MAKNTILDVKDTVNGGQGIVQIDIEGSLETMFHVKNVEAFIEKNKESLAIAGTHFTGAVKGSTDTGYDFGFDYVCQQ